MRLSDILIFVMFMLLLMPAARATIGIGVEPTVVRIQLQNIYKLSVYVWDISDTDDNYTFSVSDSIRSYIQQDCTGSNWCEGKGFYVPAGTARKGNEVLFNFVRSGDAAASVNGSITVKANPVTGNSGTVAISPQVDIRVELAQLSVTTSTTSVMATSVTTTSVYDSTGSSSGTTTVSGMPVILPPPSTVSPVAPIINEITHKSSTTVQSSITTVMQQESHMPDWAWWLVTLGVLAAAFAGGYLFLRWYF